MGGVMDSPPTSKHSQKLCEVTAKCCVVLAIICNLAAALVYYLLDLPRVPRPDLGNIYPIRNHYTVIYWTQTELWAHRLLSVLAVSFFGIALLIGWKLGLFKRRS